MTRVLTGDCRELLAGMPDASVHCCVTFPPYWGLRDYGTARWDGGDPECDHSQENVNPKAGHLESIGGNDRRRSRQVCHRCGARLVDAQLGMEETPEEYIDAMVGIFREVRRVLRPDGTLWLNMGDSYAANGGAHDGRKDNQRGVGAKRVHEAGCGDSDQRRAPCGLKPKDLVGMPWRLALALQADGWWLRQDIVWHKPNPMPESVRDRCTKAHEYVFLLTKSQRYYYDQAAIMEPIADDTNARYARGRSAHHKWADGGPGGQTIARTLGPMHDRAQRWKTPDGWDTSRGNGGHGSYHRDGREKGAATGRPGALRNRRSVWTVATQPFHEAHFATFPPELIRPCILAGCPVGGTVLDPFGGAGTVGMVAEEEGRNAILMELKPEYAAMARRRTAQPGLFGEVGRTYGTDGERARADGCE